MARPAATSMMAPITNQAGRLTRCPMLVSVGETSERCDTVARARVGHDPFDAPGADTRYLAAKYGAAAPTPTNCTLTFRPLPGRCSGADVRTDRRRRSQVPCTGAYECQVEAAASSSRTLQAVALGAEVDLGCVDLDGAYALVVSQALVSATTRFLFSIPGEDRPRVSLCCRPCAVTAPSGGDGRHRGR
jgi:hypothetical protein